MATTRISSTPPTTIPDRVARELADHLLPALLEFSKPDGPDEVGWTFGAVVQQITRTDGQAAGVVVQTADQYAASLGAVARQAAAKAVLLAAGELVSLAAMFGPADKASEEPTL
jgi:hypothetical protein